MCFSPSCDSIRFQILKCLCGGLFFLLPEVLFAIDFRDIIPLGTELEFEQRNQKEGGITGTSILRYSRIQEGKRNLLKEETIHKNKLNAHVAQTILFFQEDTGLPFKSIDKEYKSGKQNILKYSPKSIETKIIQNNTTTTHSTRNTSETISYPLLTIYLRKNIQRLSQKRKFKFKLYLPFLLPQLKKMGLPPQFSTIQVKAEVKGEKKISVSSRPIWGIEVLVKPTSQLVMQLLPKNQRNLLFVIGMQAPHHLLKARFGGKELILTDIRQF